jgi:hypothetical protein
VNACVHTYTKPRTSSTRSRGLGRRIHGSVEDTKLSTNKQHSVSLSCTLSIALPGRVLENGTRGSVFTLSWSFPCLTDLFHPSRTLKGTREI